MSPEKLARALRHMDARVLFEERLCRLDPLLWAPQLEAAALPRRAVDPAYDAARTANRPFRRAFADGEQRRRVLLNAGLGLAAERNRKAAGL